MVCGGHMYIVSGVAAGYTGGGLSQNSYNSNGGIPLYNKDSLYNTSQNLLDLPVYEKSTLSDTNIAYEATDTQQNYANITGEDENSMYDLNRATDTIEAQVENRLPMFAGKRKSKRKEMNKFNPNFDIAISGGNVDDVEYQTSNLDEMREISQYLPSDYLGNVVYIGNDVESEEDEQEQQPSLTKSKQDLASKIQDELAGFDVHQLPQEQHEHQHHDHHKHEDVNLLYN